MPSWFGRDEWDELQDRLTSFDFGKTIAPTLQTAQDIIHTPIPKPTLPALPLEIPSPAPPPVMRGPVMPAPEAPAPFPTFDLQRMLGTTGGGGPATGQTGPEPSVGPSSSVAGPFPTFDTNLLKSPPDTPLPSPGETVSPAFSATAATAVPQPGARGTAVPATGGGSIEAYIRQAAAARGIDPNIAVRVAQSEGGLDNPVRQSDYVNPSTGLREQCYDGETRVLTRRGFIHFSDLSFDDEIATRSPSGFIEYQRPEHIQRFAYRGPMYRFKTRTIDLLVTPGHNMLAARHNDIWDNGKLRGDVDDFAHLVTAEQMPMQARSWNVPSRAIWNSESMMTESPLMGGNLNDFAAYAGLYLAEGHAYHQGRNGSNTSCVSITQKEGSRLAAVRRIVAGIGVRHSEWVHEATRRWTFASWHRPLHDWAHPLGMSAAKYVPRDLLMTPTETLNALFTGLMLGDGHTDRLRYTTISRQLAEDVAEIAIKLGYGASIRVSESHKKKPYRTYRTNLHITPSYELDMKRHLTVIPEWDGEVFDATVPNHVMLVERHGNITWSGNSFGPFQLYLGGGLGNAALKQGIDPRDPAQWQRGVDFALDNAAQSGWGAWYGAARAGIAPRQGLENARAIGVSAPVGDVGRGGAGAAGDVSTPAGAAAARAVTLPPPGQTVSDRFAAGSLTPDQFNSGLSTADAYAACGPAAAIAFARRTGRNPTLPEAVELAKQVGWSAAQGMAGPMSEVNLLRSMGIASTMGGVDHDKIAADVQRGNPVILDTPGHYFVAERYDPASGKFDFGSSAKALRASGGQTWFTLGEVAQLGMGALRAAIHMDNPESPSPSVVAGASPPTPPPTETETTPVARPALAERPTMFNLASMSAGPIGQSGAQVLPQQQEDAYGTGRYPLSGALDGGADTGLGGRALGAAPAPGADGAIGAAGNLPAPPVRDIRGDYAPADQLSDVSFQPSAGADSRQPTADSQMDRWQRVGNAIRDAIMPPVRGVQNAVSSLIHGLQPTGPIVQAQDRPLGEAVPPLGALADTVGAAHARGVAGVEAGRALDDIPNAAQAIAQRAAEDQAARPPGPLAGVGERVGEIFEPVGRGLSAGGEAVGGALRADLARTPVTGPLLAGVADIVGGELGQVAGAAGTGFQRFGSDVTGGAIPRPSPDQIRQGTEQALRVGESYLTPTAAFVPAVRGETVRAAGTYLDDLLARLGAAEQAGDNQTAALLTRTISEIAGPGPVGETRDAMIARAVRAVTGTPVEGLTPRALVGAAEQPRETTAFDPSDPNITYGLRHKIVDLRDLITSHDDRFRVDPRYPSEMQPRQRDRLAAQAQVQRIANDLNPDALLSDSRSLTTGSPIVGPDNLVESGNGRVMALRRAINDHPDRAQAYRDAVGAAAESYGIDPSELRGKKFPVLVRERLDDVDRAAFARMANDSNTAVLSGYERALGDAERLTDELVGTVNVSANQSIDEALSSAGNRDLVRAFVGTLPPNEAGTMVDDAGTLSSEGLQRIKKALIVKAYGNSSAGQRMARSLIESIDPGVKNVETAIYGSLPSVARLEAVSQGGELSIAGDIATAADMYARLKQNRISLADYLAQGSLWERETSPVQDTLMQAFERNKNSSRRIRDVLEGYARAAEPQARPDQGDLFGSQVARASKEDILDAAIRDAGGPGPAAEAASAAAPSGGAGLDRGAGAAQRVPAAGAQRGGATGVLDGGVGGPGQPIAAPTGQVPLSGEGGLYVGRAGGPRTVKRLQNAQAEGRPIELTEQQEIDRIRFDKIFPVDQIDPEGRRELIDIATNAARNADWFREQRRGVVPDVEVQAAAQRMFASIDEAIAKGKPGQAFNPEETVMLRNLMRGQTEVVADLSARLADPSITLAESRRLVPEQLAEAQKLTALFQVAEGARAEAGRTLRQYREYARSLKDNPTEAGIRYITKVAGDEKKAEELIARYVQLVQDGASPQELGAMLRNVNPGWANRLNLIRYGSMLSATQTHLTNIGGNVLSTAGGVIERPLAAAADIPIAALTGRPRQRFFGETGEMVKGQMQGTSVGLRDMVSTLRTGVNPNEIQTIDNLRGGFGLNIPVLAPEGSRRAAVGNFLIEGPVRSLSAADAFFQAVNRGGHTRAIAYRKASQEGLTGQARVDRAQEIVQNLYKHLDVLDAADAAAKRSVLQEDRIATQGAMMMRDGINKAAHAPLGDVLLPFVKTPVNIVAQGLEMSPAGAVSLLKDIKQGRTGEAADTAARIVLGTALMAGVYQIASQGGMTGGWPEDQKDRSTLPPGWQPYSLKVGDKYISYANLGPMGVPMTAAVLAAEAQKQGKPIASPELALKMARYLGDQTFMRGISDFVKVINSPDGTKAENFVENIATQYAPYAALGRQIERSLGMAQRDPHGAWEALQATYPVTAGSIDERRDTRGQPIMPTQTGIETFVNPLRTSTEQPDQVLSVLRRSGIGIGDPPTALVVEPARSGQPATTVTLTPAQRTRYQQYLYAELQDAISDLADPTRAEQAMGRARDRARRTLLDTLR